MKVDLFVTCVVDQLRPEVGMACVDVLTRLGCEVRFDPRQTCCGQPAVTAGYPLEARRVAESLLRLYDTDDCEALVVPSGSCAATIAHVHDLAPDDAPWVARCRRVQAKTFEFSSFLVDRLGVEDVGAAFEGRVTWHDGCHALRELGIREAPRRLLSRVRGLELLEAPNCADCCGFGGVFSAKLPEVSLAMVTRKLEGWPRPAVDAVLSTDVSCLLQLEGALARRGSPTRALHLAEVLARRAEDVEGSS